MSHEPGHTIPDIPYGGAPTVFLSLLANGVVIEGDSTHKGHENAIECVYFTSSVETVRITSGSGMSTGRRSHGPIVVRKLIDKATPLLARALVHNEEVEGTFAFYRPDPGGTGAEQRFFTIGFGRGRVAGQTTYSPDNVALPAAPGSAPFMEELHFVYQRITWRYEDGGIEFEDSWAAL